MLELVFVFLVRQLLVVGLENFLDIETALGNRLEVTQHTLLAIFDDHDFLLVHEELQLVRDEHNQLVLQESFYALMENIVSNLWIDCTQRVVKEIDVRLRVDGPRKTDPGLLAS